MPKVTTALKDTQIKQAKPKEKEYNLSDGNGLALRIRPNGAKNWTFTYQTPVVKKRFKISFGSYPDVTLQQARLLRDEARELLAMGIDPNTHRKKVQQDKIERLDRTFKHFVDDYLSKRQAHIQPKTYNKNRGILYNHVIPNIGNIAIEDITAKDFRSFVDPMYEQEPSDTIRRICTLSSNVMEHAFLSGMIPHNPLTGLHKLYPAPKHEHHPQVSFEELPKLVQDIAKYKNMPAYPFSRTLVAGNLTLWQLHTMTRSTEAATARWCDIDTERNYWKIPVSKRIKGKKTLYFRIPLTKQTQAILEEMRPISGHLEYIFPMATDHTRPRINETATKTLNKLGYKGIQDGHGFRGLASTTLTDKGFDSFIVNKCLSHGIKDPTEASYNHSDFLEQRKPIMDFWSRLLEQAYNGEDLNNTYKGLKVVGYE